MNQLISVGDLIDQSWSMYRSHFRSFMKLSAWLFVIAILTIIALLLYPDVATLSYEKTLSQQQGAGVILFAIVNMIISPLLGYWVFISVAHAASSALSRTPITLSLIWRDTKAVYIHAAVVAILVGLVLFLAQIITLGPAVLVGWLGAWMGNTPLLVIANLAFVIGVFASLILTSRWTVYYILSPYATILDRVKSISALKQSRTLIQGKFWSVLVRYVLPKFVFLLFGLFAATLLSLFIESLVGGTPGLDINVVLRLNTLASSVITILVAIFLNPLFILSDVLLYKDLKRAS